MERMKGDYYDYPPTGAAGLSSIFISIHPTPAGCGVTPMASQPKEPF
jgi:hypothetical protein